MDAERIAAARWWVIAEPELLSALRRVASGANPDGVMVELLANSRSEER